MVGRDLELGLLVSAFEAATAGDPQVVVVRGAAGIGKTRLVRELVAQLPEPTTVAFGHALPPPGGSLPFGVCADLLRSVARAAGPDAVRKVLGPRTSVVAPLVPSLGDGAAGTVDRFALMAATQDVLCGLAEDTSPLVLVVEDAHWCDSSSMELLSFWARSLVRGRVLVVITTRESVDDETVVGLLGSIGRLPNATVADLSPLSAEQVKEQAVGLDPALSAARLTTVAALSDGNPLYVEELVAHGGDGVSRAVALDLSVGLRELPADAVKILDMLALESRPVDGATLATVTHASSEQVEAALDAAFSRGLVARREATSWQFHHELLRRAAVETQKPSSLAAGHRAWAEHLDRLPNPSLGDLVAAAAHWAEAGERRRAFCAFRAAAEVSDRVAPSLEAFALWRSALALVHEDPRVASEAERRDVFGRAATIMVGPEDWAALVEAEKAAMPNAAGAWGWFFRCWTYNQQRRFGNDVPDLLSREQLTAVIEELLDEEPDGLLAATLFEVFYTAEWQGFHEEMDAAVAALAQVEQALPREVSAGMDVVLGSRLATLRGPDAAAQRLELVESALEAGRDRDWGTLSWLHAVYAALLIAHGRLGEGLAQAETSMALVPGEENEPHWYVGALNALWALWLTGQWDASLQLAARCGADGTAVFHQFQAAVLRGQPLATEASEASGSGAAVGSEEAARDPETYRALRLCRRLAFAQSAVLARDQRAAVGLREALEDFPVLGMRAGEALVLLAEMAGGLPDPDPALEEAIRAVAADVLSWGGALDDAWLAHLDAVLLRQHGRDDAQTWRRVAETWDQMGVPAEAARCRLPLAAQLLGAGDRDGAAHELGQALRTFDDLGAAPLSKAAHLLAAQGRLRLPGDADRPATGSSGAQKGTPRGGLTEREYEVLQLVVVGKTNDQIAAALFMSPKTASVHVSHIFGKLGAANRTEVAAIAHRRGLVETA
jgi:DNA-binding NarL/FixJ family response regulator